MKKEDRDEFKLLKEKAAAFDAEEEAAVDHVRRTSPNRFSNKELVRFSELRGQEEREKQFKRGAAIIAAPLLVLAGTRACAALEQRGDGEKPEQQQSQTWEQRHVDEQPPAKASEEHGAQR